MVPSYIFYASLVHGLNEWNLGLTILKHREGSQVDGSHAYIKKGCTPIQVYPVFCLLMHSQILDMYGAH